MFKNILRDFRKGFTLVELLVVIAVLGVLAAGLIVAVNPADKIRLANDSTVQNQVGQLASAASAYATQHVGSYPTAVATLGPGAGNSGEMTVIPTAPVGTNAAGTVTYNTTAAGWAVLPAGCTTAGNTCTEVRIFNAQTSLSHAALPMWMYCSRTGRVGAVANSLDASCL